MADEVKAEPGPVPAPAGAFVPGGPTPNLTAALVACVRSTPWIEYTKPEKGGGINYEYLSEEDIVKELRKQLPAHGLTVVPEKMELVNKELYSSSNGGRMVNLLIVTTFRVSHTSGEFFTGQAFGEGSDRGDKAANKAMTGAFKYFLRELTLIAGGNDPDRTSSDELARAAKSQPGRSASGPGGQTQPKKPSGGSEKPLDDRAKDAMAHIAKLSKQEDIRATYKKCAEVFAGRKDLLSKIQAACASRAAVLFVLSIGKADDLETIDALVKEAEKDKVPADAMAKIRAAAENRAKEIAGSPGEEGSEPSGGDDAEPLDF